MTRLFLAVLLVLSFVPGCAGRPPRTGAAAYGDWHDDAPGVVRHITPDAMPPPYATRSAARGPSVVTRPAGATLHVPPGFVVDEFASGSSGRARCAWHRTATCSWPKAAPAGSACSAPPDGAARPASTGVFADGPVAAVRHRLLAARAGPAFVYVAETARVVRFPYRSGDLQARGPAEVVVPTAGHGGHWTRDVVFSPDGHACSSRSARVPTSGTEMAPKDQAEARAWDAAHGLGAAWGQEEDRADVLAFDPEGQGGHVFAAGLRNCSPRRSSRPTARCGAR